MDICCGRVFLPHLPRLKCYTLGVKIDNLFVELLEITFTAKYARREDKLNILEELSKKLDNLKFFITLLWEAKGLAARDATVAVEVVVEPVSEFIILKILYK